MVLLKIVFSAVLIYGLVVASLYLFQRRILFVPGTTLLDREAVGVPDMNDADLISDDGLTLRSWYRAAMPRRPTIVYFQGNAGTISGRGFKARPLMDHGYGVLLVGHRGYGGNPGFPSEDGLIDDGRAALKFLAAQGVRAKDIILYGESLGSGVAVALAAGMSDEEPPGAIILEAPFTSIVEIAASRYRFVPVRFLIKDRFDSLARVDQIHAPMLILHGARDGVINIQHGKTLHEAANEPKQFVLFDEGRHSDLYDHGALEAVVGFVDNLWDN
ncbi:MAG: alpha/beta hydrolase [Alphaproteobacteria bacterium]|nr:alpha/beta hydrolase [Alphaproteobacteria bacterium]